MNARRKTKRWLWWTITVLLSGGLCVAESKRVSQTLTRAQLEAITPPSIALSPAYPDASATHRLEITLKFAQQAMVVAGGNAWSYSVQYHITVAGAAGASRKLTLFRGVDHDVFTDVDVIDPVTLNQTTVVIEGVSSPDMTAVPQSLQLSATVTSTRYSAFSPQTEPVLTSANGSNPTVSWAAISGAEEYEVEIAFIDARETAQVMDPFASNLPVRIQTTATTMLLELHRPAGTLYYRVRAVGRHPGGQARRPGAWSSTLPFSVGATSFESNKNWYYKEDYDQSGASNATLTYFDSILQPRQVQKTAPDQHRRLVAETKYDYEGRPAVSFLATPTDGHQLSYLAGFNRAADGSVFGPQHFDSDNVTAASSNSGAGKYFSGQTDATGPAADFVPDAGGYPFSVAQHTRDNSTRLRAMSGFGAKLKLGAGHDTTYIYGDTSESQLRQLFGANLGNAGNYERTITGDANRVYEVQYRDSEDHIISQGQIGVPPANLYDLANPPAAQDITVNMDESNHVDAAQGRSDLSYRIANAVNTNYFFSYSVNGVEYSADPGDPRFPPLCESCRYQLKIRILDPSGAKVPLAVGSTEQNDAQCTGAGATIQDEIDQVIQNNQTHTCQAGVDSTTNYATPPVKFCAKLTEAGEYQVRKELTLLAGSIDASIESYESKPGYFNASSYRKDPDPSSCGGTCSAHCAEATGVNPATSPNDPNYQKCMDACQNPQDWTLKHVENDKCESLKSELGADMAPGGRYYHQNGNNDVTQHPEYCHVGVCQTLKPSDHYDVVMGEVQTYSDALCKGYLNPLGLPTNATAGPPPLSATCTGTPIVDPFFAAGGPGATLAAAASSDLSRYSDTISGWSGSSGSIWQFAADPLMHQNATTISLDDQWKSFRSLYLGIKQKYVEQATESPAILNCPYSTDSHAHVPKAPLPNTADAVISAIDSAEASQCQGLCTVRVSQWMSELTQACGSAPTNPNVKAGLGQYCDASCGKDNPLALLTKEALASGAPGLATANAGLQGCNLGDIAVSDPYIRTTTCRENCCSDSAASKCAQLLVDVVREREPMTRKETVPVVDSDTGRQFVRCLDWIQELHISEGVVQFQNKGATRSCLVVFVGPDGKPIPAEDVRILSSPSPGDAPPAIATRNLPRFTGLFVDVEVKGKVVRAAIYSDCNLSWVDKLSKATCTTQVVSRSSSAQSCKTDSHTTDSGIIGDEAHLNGVSRNSGGVCVPTPVVPTTCPQCLKELVKLFESQRGGRGGAIAGQCLTQIQRAGNSFQLTQASGNSASASSTSATCRLLLIKRDGTELPASAVMRSGRMMENVPRPVSLPANVQGAQYLDIAVEVETSSGPVTVFLYSDCDFHSFEHCGSSCTLGTRASACLTSVLKQLTLPPRRPSRQPDRASCYSNLQTLENEVGFTLSGTRKPCKLVVLDKAGRPVRPARLRGASAQGWNPDDPAAPHPPRLTFTGVEILVGQAGRTKTYYVFSDCKFEPESDCSTFVTGTTLTPPSIGDPHDVCTQATSDAADQAAEISVEQARGDFEREFKTVHYNRCFGDQLKEHFEFAAQAQEYHFTLRYYDQAGNLEQTVPPEGIAPLNAAQVAAYGTAGGTTVNPNHRMVSRYQFDSLNRILQQTTPDSGERDFYYNRRGQLRFAQNAQQKIDGKFAYTKYDSWDRVVEFGLLTPNNPAIVTGKVDDRNFPSAADGTLEEVVNNYYDTADAVPACAPLGPRNLRSRLAAVVATTVLGAATLCYSHDAQGYISSVLRDEPGLGVKTTQYELDAVSGRVKSVQYQAGKSDALYQRNTYDRRGALTDVESSRDNVLWEPDAHYDYYEYGPVARVTVGADGVQGLDYTYTIQGWPKGLNTGTLAADRDPGKDGAAGSGNAGVARDVVGTSLEYFDGDYTPVGLARGTLSASASPHSQALLSGTGGQQASAFAADTCSPLTISDGCGLFAGNVVRGVLGLEGIDPGGRITGFAYHYDRLYRLRTAIGHHGLDPATNSWPLTDPSPVLWQSAVGYDDNGNISTLKRSAPQALGPAQNSALMDDLTYRYPRDTANNLISNQLLHVNDAVPAARFPNDMDDQGAYPAGVNALNFAYDAAGNLIRDNAANIVKISWNARNRVSRVQRAQDVIEFSYDGKGERIAKIREPSTDPKTWVAEYFARDEAGHLLATYSQQAQGTGTAPGLVTPEELYLRGASTLGLIRADNGWPSAIPPGTFAQVGGDKQYQISNYLGHVLATVSDRRNAIATTANGTAVEHYEAQLLSTDDYDPFGALVPGRSNEQHAYRFGFAGFERDDDLKGPGNSYYTEERLFDPRIARWLSPDPVELASVSPYVAFSDDPLRYGDPRGQIDWDAVKDVAENVAITAGDISKDTIHLLSGAALAEGIADNLVKAKEAYDRGDTMEAAGWALQINGAVQSLAEKDLAWQDGGATLEDRVRLGIGEVSGMNDVMRGVTGATEFGKDLSTPERLMVGIQGGVKVVTIAATGAQLVSGALESAASSAERPPEPGLKTGEGGTGCPTPFSFAPDTPVWTPGGPVMIGSIATGDLVETVHPESGQPGEFAVTHTSVAHHHVATDLTLTGTDGWVTRIRTTPEHSFWVEGKGWIEAGRLSAGEHLASRSGRWLSITSARSFPLEFNALSLSVDDANTYFVGAAGVWVHNCNGKLPKSVVDRSTTQNQARMKQGKPPLDKTGEAVELHHKGQNPNSKLVEMTREQHRGPGNFSKNHKNTGQQPSKIDRGKFKKEREAYWKKPTNQK